MAVEVFFLRVLVTGAAGPNTLFRLDDLCGVGFTDRCWVLPEARDCVLDVGAASLDPNLWADAAVCVVRELGSLTGRVGDLDLGLTDPALDEGTSTEAGLDAVFALAVFLVLEVVVGILVDSFALVALAGIGDLRALVAVLAVETGARVLGASFVVLGTLVAVVTEPLLTLSSELPPPLEEASPIFRADDSVGLPGSNVVFGSSSSVTLSGLALGLVMGLVEGLAWGLANDSGFGGTFGGVFLGDI